MRPRTGGGPARYQEIMRTIAEDISSGRVRVGDRLPTEEELCAQYDAGRHTVREAIRGLVDLGMVERRPRVGTRVVSAEPVTTYRWLPVSGEDMATNMKATWIVGGKGESVKADAALATRLGCDVGARWFRFAGARVMRSPRTREPLCFSEQYVPDTAKARKMMLTAEGLHVTEQRIEQEIRAELLTEEQADALHCAAGSPALVVVRRHWHMSGRLVAIGIHTHPSDRFSIRMDLSTSNGAESR